MQPVSVDLPPMPSACLATHSSLLRSLNTNWQNLYSKTLKIISSDPESFMASRRSPAPCHCDYGDMGSRYPCMAWPSEVHVPCLLTNRAYPFSALLIIPPLRI